MQACAELNDRIHASLHCAGGLGPLQEEVPTLIKRVTYTALPDIPLVEPGDDLATLVITAMEKSGTEISDGDIFVIAQKIFSKTENRYLRLDDLEPSSRALELADGTGKDARYIEAILSESREVVRTRGDLIVVEHRLGFVMANAGIDESNIAHDEGRRVLLLPENPDRSCAELREALRVRTGKNLGVVMNDSFGRPWRNGVVGVAIGSAGIPSLIDLVGHPDLFGRSMRVTEIAIADELAAAGSLIMGQANEGLPVVHIAGLRFSSPINPASALVRPKGRDMFR